VQQRFTFNNKKEEKHFRKKNVVSNKISSERMNLYNCIREAMFFYKYVFICSEETV
jgi:hypothetical protein